MTKPGLNDHSSNTPTVIFPIRKPSSSHLDQLRIRHHSWQNQHTLDTTAAARRRPKPDSGATHATAAHAIVSVGGSCSSGATGVPQSHILTADARRTTA